MRRQVLGSCSALGWGGWEGGADARSGAAAEPRQRAGGQAVRKGLRWHMAGSLKSNLSQTGNMYGNGVVDRHGLDVRVQRVSPGTGTNCACNHPFDNDVDE